VGSNAYAWLRRTVEMLVDGSNPEEFLEHTKLELFHDQVFCFTPKGKLIALPRKATAIDFAYAVHTGVGNAAVGCRINGKSAPIISELQNGDEVEIVTVKGTSPPAAWESIVITGKARAAIRRATRAAVRDQYAGLGREMVRKLFERIGKPFEEDVLVGALGRLARGSVADVMAAVGRNELKASDVVRAMYPDYKEERLVSQARADMARATAGGADPGWVGLRKNRSIVAKLADSEEAGAAALPIRGANTDLPVRFAPNGGAVPGDRIVGILTKGEGITIYPIHSPSLKIYDDQPERWIDLRWDLDREQIDRFPARIAVHSVNDGNIDNVRMVRPSPDFTDLTIDIGVYDLKHLNSIVSQLRAKSFISDVQRVNE
jgi:(p)ppGpp synthase/HD superfamily hydrolase